MPPRKTMRAIVNSARRLSKRSKKNKCPPGQALYLQCRKPCTKAKNGRQRIRSMNGTHKYTDKEYDDLFNNVIRG